MPKRAQKPRETRPFSFRLPVEVYNDLAAVAESRGVDVSSILNWIITEKRPALLLKKINLAGSVTSVEGACQAVETMTDLLGHFQEAYTTLMRQILTVMERAMALVKDEEAREAA